MAWGEYTSLRDEGGAEVRRARVRCPVWTLRRHDWTGKPCLFQGAFLRAVWGCTLVFMQNHRGVWPVLSIQAHRRCSG